MLREARSWFLLEFNPETLDDLVAAHGEMFGTFAKIEPFLAEMRATFGEPAFCRHFEAVVTGEPDAAAILARRRERLRMAAAARAAPRRT